MPQRNGSVLSATIWMFVLSILLFWLPFIGPLIAGWVGGRKAGSIANAVLAVFLPGILVGGAIFFFASVLTGVPLFGLMVGLGGGLLALGHISLLLVGGILGAAL